MALRGNLTASCASDIAVRQQRMKRLDLRRHEIGEQGFTVYCASVLSWPVPQHIMWMSTYTAMSRTRITQVRDGRGQWHTMPRLPHEAIIGMGLYLR
jgi:hypothetical protein